jgi:hypothetical protein
VLVLDRVLLERWMNDRAYGDDREYVAVNDRVRDATEAFLAQHQE